MRINRTKKVEAFLGMLFLIAAIGFGVNIFNTEVALEDDPYVEVENEKTQIAGNVKELSDNLKVHFVDVGQGDAIIIEQNNHYMLIDAGPNSGEQKLLNYIDSLNIKEFDYIVGTHPHEDHIGGMDKVIKNYTIDKVLFPKVTTTTKTFETFVKEIKNKNLKLYSPKAKESFKFEDSTFEVLAPNSEKYDELNNYSIVIKFTYKDVSVLFTGDAETLSESEILEAGIDVKADVIKIGHHGSSTSTSTKFLNSVSPKYAVISVGTDNDYGHPHKSTMERLKSFNIPVYRTDEQSTIILETDGTNIKFNKQQGSYAYNKEK